ncbi:MAG: hypothetical protein AAF740_14255 [Bacteroidota bacterium]
MVVTELAAQRYDFIQRITNLSDTQFQLLYQIFESFLRDEDALLEQLEIRRVFDNQHQHNRIDSVIDILEDDE